MPRPIPAAGIRVGVASAVTALAGSGAKLTHVFRRRFPVVAVTGMTGVGKTRLVDRLARHTTPDGAAKTREAAC